MKKLFVLLILIIPIMGVISCQKGNSNNANLLTGKWQEIKLRTYIVDSGKITYDTTYLKPFTNLDYIQFVKSDSCDWSIDHYYYNNSPGEPKTPQLIPQNISAYSYASIGNAKFTLAPDPLLITPAGFITTDTVSEIGSSNLLIHNVFYAHDPEHLVITDSYFQK